MAPLLMAAAAPPCGQAPPPGDQVPVPLDLSGHPVPRTPLVSSALTMPDATASCDAAPGSGSTTHDPRADALHGLPTPDMMQVIPSETGH